MAALETLRAKRKLLIAAIETAYGVDEVPTAAANSIETMDLVIQPVQGPTENRDIDRDELGRDLTFQTAPMVRITCKVSIAGAGAAGTVPAWGVLARAAGRSETVDPGVDVRYAMISEGFESASFWVHQDGHYYRALGARGSMRRRYQHKTLPYFEFDYMAQWLPAEAGAIPNAVLGAFRKPVPVNFVNTTGFAVHGVSPQMRSLQLDDAQQVEQIDVAGCREMSIEDREPGGQLVIEDTLVSDKDWDSAIVNSETGTLTLQHGQTAGNIVEEQLARVQLIDTQLGEEQKRQTRTMGLAQLPVDGDDESVLIVR